MHDLELRATHLFTLTAELGRIDNLGQTPMGGRRIVEVTGGSFEGEELRGSILPGGGDWILLRPDGVLMLDVRLTLKTDDGHLIYMAYRGMRHGPEWVIERLNKGEKVDPSEYYFRTTPYFETASEKYGWLNRVVSVASGHRVAGGAIYQVFEVL